MFSSARKVAYVKEKTINQTLVYVIQTLVYINQSLVYVIQGLVYSFFLDVIHFFSLVENSAKRTAAIIVRERW